MEIKHPPPSLPRSPADALALGSEAIAAITVSAIFADDGDVLLTYRLDDGAERSIKLPLTAPMPRPGQPIVLFISDSRTRFNTLPWRP